jgi:hypothetical protein
MRKAAQRRAAHLLDRLHAHEVHGHAGRRNRLLDGERADIDAVRLRRAPRRGGRLQHRLGRRVPVRGALRTVNRGPT